MITPQPGGTVYAQLAARLRDDIRAGRLRPGQRLPSEARLQQEYGLARGTIRRAVALLRTEGLVVVSRGHGVLVREEADIQDLVPAAGSTVTARMPTVDEVQEFGIPEGIPVFLVTTPDEATGIYPADRWRLKWPST